MIRSVTAQDVEAVCTIYNHYIANTVVSFEEEPVSAGEMSARIGKVRDAGLPWLVAEDGDNIVGYAYAGKWQERSAYRFCALVSVYLTPAATGKGWGTRLYQELFAALRTTSIRWVLGGIALPNAASVALHEKMGMQRVGLHPGVGYKFGRWIDVGYWQGELRGP